MKVYFFLLLFGPVILFAQEQPVNGSTDCPTFGKKNVTSKAGMFSYMRTHKPQKKELTQVTGVYQTSALPDLKKAQEDRDAAQLKRNNQPAVSKKQRQVKEHKVKENPVVSPKEENVPEKEIASASPVKKEEKNNEEEADVKKETIHLEKSAAREEAKEKREKKAKRAALKAKTKSIFKSDKKRSSRKNVQKCPSF